MCDRDLKPMALTFGGAPDSDDDEMLIGSPCVRGASGAGSSRSILYGQTQTASPTDGALRSAFSPLVPGAGSSLMSMGTSPGATPPPPSSSVLGSSSIRRAMTFASSPLDENDTGLAMSMASSPTAVPMPERVSSPVPMMPPQSSIRDRRAALVGGSRARAHTTSGSSNKLRKAASVANLGIEPGRPAYNVRASGQLPPRCRARTSSVASQSSQSSVSSSSSSVFGSVAKAGPVPRPESAAARSLKRARSSLSIRRNDPLSMSTPSLFAGDAKSARDTSTTPPIADYKPKLPTLETGRAGYECNIISPGTLVEIMDGKHDDVVTSLFVIDCRFPFEFKGGHIAGALNLHTPAMLEEFFMKDRPGPGDTPPTIVFHCEFSSKRGPSQYKHLRGLDRYINVDRYPAVDYPEIYVLQGGYKAFFTLYKTRCEPQAYRTMFDPKAKEECNEHMVKLRQTYKRSRSFSDVARLFQAGGCGSDDDGSDSDSDSDVETSPMSRRPIPTPSFEDSPSSVAARQIMPRSPTFFTDVCNAATAADDMDDGLLDTSGSPTQVFSVRPVLSDSGSDSGSDESDDSDSDDGGVMASPSARPRQRQRTLGGSNRSLKVRSCSMADLPRRVDLFG